MLFPEGVVFVGGSQGDERSVGEIRTPTVDRRLNSDSRVTITF